MSVVKWTPELNNAVKGLWEKRYSASQISTELWLEHRANFSRNAVCGQLSRMGLTRTKIVRSQLQKSKPVRSPPPKRITPFIPPVGPAEPRELRCVEITPRHLSLIDLEPGDCRYPYGNSDFTFCGHLQVEGSPYCLDHLALCVGRGTHSERRTNFYDVKAIA